MENNRLEKTTIGTAEVETSGVLSPEKISEISSTETSSNSSAISAPSQEDNTKTEKKSVETEVEIQIPKISAGYPINSNNTDSSKIVLEKLTGMFSNL